MVWRCCSSRHSPAGISGMKKNKYFINVDVYKYRFSITNLNIYIYKNDKEIIRIIIGDQFRYE